MTSYCGWLIHRVRSYPCASRGVKGEYLWEFDIAERQLLALAEAFPAERYGWRPADTARSVSEVLVHVAAGNLRCLASWECKRGPRGEPSRVTRRGEGSNATLVRGAFSRTS
jgi:hypothetical protein